MLRGCRGAARSLWEGSVPWEPSSEAARERKHRPLR